MNPKIPHSLKILKEACIKYGYDFRIVDKIGNNLVEVSDSEKSFFSSNRRPGTFPLNSSFASGITKDKTWTSKILNEKGFRVIRGEHFFLNKNNINHRKSGRELNDAIGYAKKRYPIFVKPNDSSSGLHADVIYNEKELKTHLAKIEKITEIGIIQELKRLPEYRIFAVDGRVQFMYRREFANLRGDGKRTIRELLREKNKKIIKSKNKISERGVYLQKVLAENKLKSSSIFTSGRKIQISSKANLSAGGEIDEYVKKVPKKVEKWASDLMKIFSLRVCGIDVFVDGEIDSPNNYIVIEVNPNPGLSGIYRAGYGEDAIKVWGVILRKYFAKQGLVKRMAMIYNNFS